MLLSAFRYAFIFRVWYAVGALACYFYAIETGAPLLLALSYTGFFPNLFNLIPISPLDSGRIIAVLSPRVWLLGVPILVG